jgi:hypothetical protein
MKDWQTISDNLRKARWRCGCISSTNEKGRQIWVATAERSDVGRFIVYSDENPTVFIELEAAISRQLNRKKIR